MKPVHKFTENCSVATNNDSKSTVMLAVMTVKLRTWTPEGKDRCSTEQEGLSLATGPLPHNPRTSGNIILEKQVCEHVTNTFSLPSRIRKTQRM